MLFRTLARFATLRESRFSNPDRRLDLLGAVIAGPLYDRERILFADLDLGEIVRGKVDFDVVGHYARPDVFQLIVNEQSALPVRSK